MKRRSGLVSGSTRFWWLRHGPVPGAEGGRLSGRTDWPCDLSDTATLAWLRRRIPAEAAFISSPLRRARDTGMAVLGRPPDGEDERLAEQDFGSWTGRTWTELGEESRACGFWDDPAFCRPPGGESFGDQCRRVAAFIDEASRSLAGQDVLVACHGGTTRAAIACALAASAGGNLAKDAFPGQPGQPGQAGQAGQAGLPGAEAGATHPLQEYTAAIRLSLAFVIDNLSLTRTDVFPSGASLVCVNERGSGS